MFRGGTRCSAFTFDAVGVAVLFAGDLGPVADKETGPASELIVGLRDDLDDELVGNEVSWKVNSVDGVSFVHFQNRAAGVGFHRASSTDLVAEAQVNANRPFRPPVAMPNGRRTSAAGMHRT